MDDSTLRRRQCVLANSFIRIRLGSSLLMLMSSLPRGMGEANDGEFFHMASFNQLKHPSDAKRDAILLNKLLMWLFAS